MTKAFGRDINEYYNNHFPEGAYLEHCSPLYDSWEEKYGDRKGNIFLPDDKKFELTEFGTIFLNVDDKPIGSFQSLFKRWLKQQSTVTIVIEIPKIEYDEVLAHLKEYGLRILK